MKRCGWQMAKKGGGPTQTCDEPAEAGSDFCAEHLTYGWKAVQP